MSASSLGKAAEKRVRQILTDNGYTLVQSHLSRGPSDVVAMKPNQVLAVQTKRSPLKSPRVAEWNELYDWAIGAGCIPIIAFSPSVARTTFHRMTGRKDGSKRPQPWASFFVDEVGSPLTALVANERKKTQ